MTKAELARELHKKMNRPPHEYIAESQVAMQGYGKAMRDAIELIDQLTPCDCENLRGLNEAHETAIQLQSKVLRDMQKRLAVLEYALRQECDYGAAVSDKPLEEYVANCITQATAALGE